MIRSDGLAAQMLRPDNAPGQMFAFDCTVLHLHAADDFICQLLPGHAAVHQFVCGNAV
ncbi:hypothetical protein D3C81_2334180 [compost metagenome]